MQMPIFIACKIYRLWKSAFAFTFAEAQGFGFFIVELVGFEPTSRQGISKLSTCLVRSWLSGYARWEHLPEYNLSFLISSCIEALQDQSGEMTFVGTVPDKRLPGTKATLILWIKRPRRS